MTRAGRPDFYNDNDTGAAAWLGELMAGGHIPRGEVCDRSILDLGTDELLGRRRAHFFAGIGGWAEALRLANWPEWLPVWTGSPPCQPFSVAGKRGGADDARHLGPRFVELVRACRPPVLFGEQVASADVFGRAAKPRKSDRGRAPEWAWCDDLFLRLEAAGYAAWALDIPAAGIGAPHIRQRCFFAAVDLRFAAGLEHRASDGRLEWRAEPVGRGIACGRGADGLGDADIGGRSGGCGFDPATEEGCRGGKHFDPAGTSSAAHELADLHGDGRCETGRGQPEAGRDGPFGDSAARGLGDSFGPGLEEHRRDGDVRGKPGRVGPVEAGSTSEAGDTGGLADSHGGNGGAERQQRGGEHGQQSRDGGVVVGDRRPGPINGFWADADWLLCRDGKWRPAQSGIWPLADGVSGRVGLLRGTGNAIVPQAAAEAVHIARDVMAEAGIWAALQREYQEDEVAA